jgi:hypothetical protein
VRSLIHSRDAVAHSPAGITAACPITVTSSRWPRALICKTQKPFSSLWYVTQPDTTRLASILVVNEMHDAMPFAKSTQIRVFGRNSRERPGAAAHPMSKVVNRPCDGVCGRGASGARSRFHVRGMAAFFWSRCAKLFFFMVIAPTSWTTVTADQGAKTGCNRPDQGRSTGEKKPIL